MAHDGWYLVMLLQAEKLSSLGGLLVPLIAPVDGFLHQFGGPVVNV
jgi:hypothetical protein